MFFFVSKRSSICIIYRIIAERERERERLKKKEKCRHFSSLSIARPFHFQFERKRRWTSTLRPSNLMMMTRIMMMRCREKRGAKGIKREGAGELWKRCVHICSWESVLLVPVSIILLSSPILFYLIATVVWNIAYGREMYNVNSSRVSLPHMFFVFKKKKKERDCEEEGSKKNTLLTVISIFSSPYSLSTV